MNFEQHDQDAPFARMEKPGFKEEVREKFADRLEDRASDPDNTEAIPLLAELAEKVRRGEKIPRKSLGPEILRGLFRSPNSAMYKRLTHAEIDKLEEDFFE